MITYCIYHYRATCVISVKSITIELCGFLLSNRYYYFYYYLTKCLGKIQSDLSPHL